MAELREPPGCYSCKCFCDCLFLRHLWEFGAVGKVHRDNRCRSGTCATSYSPREPHICRGKENGGQMVGFSPLPRSRYLT